MLTYLTYLHFPLTYLLTKKKAMETQPMLSWNQDVAEDEAAKEAREIAASDRIR